MNNSTFRRRLALAVMVFVLMTISRTAFAQCGDFTTAPLPPSQPVAMTLFLNTNTATLDDAVMTIYGFGKAVGCSYEISTTSNFAVTSPLPKVFGCGDVGATQTWYVRVNGAGGPSANSRILNINIVDNIPPTVTCVANQARNVDAGQCNYTTVGTEFNPTVTDNCSVTSTNYTLTGATTGSGANTLNNVDFQKGVTTVTWKSTDNSGLMSTCAFTVTVTDNIAPAITCPANQVRSTNNNLCTYATVGAEFNGNPTDNCPGVTAAYVLTGVTAGSGASTLNGVVLNKGITTVTWTATDAGGSLTASCNFTVTVNDTQLPNITCPTNKTFNASSVSCNYTTVIGDAGLINATATDNCTPAPTLAWTTAPAASPASGPTTLVGTTFGLGNTTVTWTATDGAANTRSCTFVVTVQDVTPPTVAAYAPVYNVNVNPGECSKVVTFDRPSIGAPAFSDCNGPVTLTEDSVFVNGVYTPAFLSGAPAFNPAVGGQVTTGFPAGQTKIQYTWTDAANKKTFRYITVNVAENEAPNAQCAASVVLTLDPITGVAVLNVTQVDAGSTDNCQIVSRTLSKTSFTCEDSNPLGVPVTLTVSDGTQTDNCVTTVYVIDNTPPVIVCPASFTIAANSGCNAKVNGLKFVPDYVSDPGEYFDNSIDYNCDLQAAIQLNGGANVFNTVVGDSIGLSNLVFTPGSNTVTVSLRDKFLNTSVCSFNVTVLDQTGPTYVSGQGNGVAITQNVNTGGCVSLVTWVEPTYTDACSLPVTLVSKSHSPNTFFPIGTTTVTYVFKDAVGNLSTHTFPVTIVDNQAPVANCKNITVALNSMGSVVVNASQIDNNSTDNCFYTYNSGPYVFGCNNLGPNNVTLTIKDFNNNLASCAAIITVVDNIAPVAVCTALSTINLDASGQFTISAAALNGGSTDNCLSSLKDSIQVGSGAYATTFTFDCSLLGTQTITYKVTDGGGNAATCSRVVTVKDINAPTFVVPANITINCQESTDPSNTGSPTDLQDNCDQLPTLTYTDAVTPGVCANERVITRTWRATDDATPANTSTANQTITVVDDTAPSFMTQTSYTIYTDDPYFCDAPLSLGITASNVFDNCSDFNNIIVRYRRDYPNPNYGYTDDAGFITGTTLNNSYFPIGTTTITWRAIDQCLNSTDIVVTVTVLDTLGPAFQPLIYQDAFGDFVCGKTYTLSNVSNTCSNTFSWRRPNSFASFFGGDIFDGCDVPITVIEDIDNASVETALNATNPYPGYYFSWFPFASNRINPVAQFPVGETTVSYTAIDPEGNSSVCAFTVIVEDTQTPAFQSCPTNVTLAATCPSAELPDYTNLTVLDNCVGNLVISQYPEPGDTLGEIIGPAPLAGDTIQVTITADDGYNTGICTFVLTLQDGDDPIPTVDPLPFYVDSCGGLIIEAPLALDPCSPNDSIWGTPSTPVGDFIPPSNPNEAPKYNLMPGNYVITWVYNDGNGNITTQPQNITVLTDIYPPIALCEAPFTIQLDGSGLANITPGDVDNGSYDDNDCGPISLSLSQTQFTCDDLGANEVVLTVSDINNIKATCSTTITVQDVTAPILSIAPPSITVEACSNIPLPATLTAVDACDDTLQIVFTEVSTKDTVGTGQYNYTITRSWSVTDDSGNSTSTNQVITVKDLQAPVFSSAAPDTVVFNTELNDLACDALVTLNMLQYITDCAEGTDLTVSNNTNAQGGLINTTFAQGGYNIIFTATDISGNSAKDTVHIKVIDGTAPIAACINGVSVSLQPSGTVTVTSAQINANSSDNCTPDDKLDLKVQRLVPLGPLANSILFDCNDADGITQHPVKLYVTDLLGNQSTCETYIIVQDNVFPTVISCPADVTVQCTADLDPQAYGTALFSDNCTVATTEYADTVVAGSGNVCKFVQRTWKGTDQANNMTTCLQVFAVQDTVAPTFSAYPPNDTISCSETVEPPSQIFGIDICSLNVLMTFTQDTIDIAQGDCGFYNYTIIRTRTATDECGNVAVYSRTITVQDVQAPQFLGLPDTITVLSANFPPNANCDVPVTLNFAQYLFDCEADSSITVTNNAPHGDGALSASGTYSVGEYKIALTAMDACGNTGVDSVLLRVVDNSIPTAICNNNVVISLGSNGEASIDAEDIDLGSVDNCAIDTMFLSVSTFDCTQLGDNDVTLTVVDVNGNFNTCTVQVEITLGVNSGFTIATQSVNETVFGAGDGLIGVTVTGGSGNFSYNWSNNATTPTVTNVPAGTYTVTVTDTENGCQQVATVTVAQGAKLTLLVGNGSGAQGETISIPVTAERFIDIASFQFSMEVSNMAVGSVVNITNINPLLDGVLNHNPLGNSYVVGYLAPVNQTNTLPNGSVLFNIEVTLGTAPVGSSSPLVIDGTPLQVEFNIDSLGTLVTIPVDIFQGTVTINSSAAQLKVAGDIMTWVNPENPNSTAKPVPNATVALAGTVTNSDVTDALGNYEFNIPNNANTNVTVTKSTAGNGGHITAADLLRIVNHIFGDTLESPYQWIAADVNNSKTISLADYLLIQRVALGTDQHIMNSPDWKFVPKSYTFPSNNTPNGGPLSVPYPQNIAHTNLTASELDDDFIGVRMGDVNGNVIPSVVDHADDRYGSNDRFMFRLEDRAAKAGEVFTVPFRAKDFVNRQAYQLTIDFDPNIFELDNIEMGVLPELRDENFGTAHIGDGHLTTLWVSRDPITLNDDEVLFTLSFRALRSTKALSEVLHAGSAITRSESYDRDGNTMPVDFEFVQPLTGAESTAFALYQNQPNPFSQTTVIGFRLPESGRSILRVYNSSGQLVKTVVGNFNKGYNEVQFERGEFGAPGVYWYELESAKNSDRKKMILMD